MQDEQTQRAPKEEAFCRLFGRYPTKEDRRKHADLLSTFDNLRQGRAPLTSGEVSKIIASCMTQGTLIDLLKIAKRLADPAAKRQILVSIMGRDLTKEELEECQRGIEAFRKSGICRKV